MDNFHITLIQSDIYWEKCQKNLDRFGKMIDEITDPTDLIVLPEMFNTGFSIDPARCAETMDGNAVSFLRNMAKKRNCMITGSILIAENGLNYNRLITMFPNGSFEQYDKRHLFRLSDEDKVMSAGKKKIIVNWKGWKILPLICYDLRFPVWSKNRLKDGEFEYDLLIYVANWPKSRSHYWKSLLVARAMENQCYVIGVNRVGKDGGGKAHSGDSMVIGPGGEIIASLEQDLTTVLTMPLRFEHLREIRKKYPFATDWDDFIIH
jgi:omega-amidase